VPVLLRRMGEILRPDVELNILRPFRIGRNRLLKPHEVERAVEFAARKMEPPRAILILIDADDDCPAEVGPRLVNRAKGARADVPFGVVLAKREFESWFLAALESLSGRRGLSPGLVEVPNAETVRDAKGVLTRSMQGTRAYSPVVDQAALAAVFDLESARRRSDSFDKLWREVDRLLGPPNPPGPP
jgi:Domain of unknown function (DUF4276)